MNFNGSLLKLSYILFTHGTGTSGTSPVGTGGAVTMNFYGPVYMSGVSADGSYDCPPNIVIQGASNQLVTSGY